MSIVARYIGKEEVIDQFRKVGKVNFSMWCKSALICQYNGDDIDEAIEVIDEEIERNIKRKMGHECFLKIHPKQETNYTLKSDVAYNIVFKSYDNPDYSTLTSPASFNHLVLEKLTSMESRLQGMEDDVDDDDDENQEDENGDKIAGYINGVNKILEHPAVMLIIDKFFKPNEAPVVKLAGTENLSNEQQQKLLSAAIQTLFNKGVTLDHFIKLSEMPADKIKSLIQFL